VEIKLSQTRPEDQAQLAVVQEELRKVHVMTCSRSSCSLFQEGHTKLTATRNEVQAELAVLLTISKTHAWQLTCSMLDCCDIAEAVEMDALTACLGHRESFASLPETRLWSCGLWLMP